MHLYYIVKNIRLAWKSIKCYTSGSFDTVSVDECSDWSVFKVDNFKRPSILNQTFFSPFLVAGGISQAQQACSIFLKLLHKLLNVPLKLNYNISKGPLTLEMLYFHLQGPEASGFKPSNWGSWIISSTTRLIHALANFAAMQKVPVPATIEGLNLAPWAFQQQAEMIISLRHKTQVQCW